MNSYLVLYLSYHPWLKTHLPHMSSWLSSQKATVFISDELEFLSDHQAITYDVVITDSSHPVGPAFSMLCDTLTPGGSISTQGECLLFHIPLLSELRKLAENIFPVSECGSTVVDTLHTSPYSTGDTLTTPKRQRKRPFSAVDPSLVHAINPLNELKIGK